MFMFCSQLELGRLLQRLYSTLYLAAEVASSSSIQIMHGYAGTCNLLDDFQDISTFSCLGISLISYF
jgi:hypothetical protein